MDSFELNKILGGVLGTCLVLLAVHIASGAIFAETPPAKPGYVIEVKEEAPAGGAAAAAPKETPIAQLLASANPQAGESAAKVCLTCHNLAKGQGAKVGPDLYGVVGRAVASEAGFNYSSALKAKGGNWTFDALNPWIENPRKDVPGTLMTFGGIPNEKQRADIIAYLNSNSDKPEPLPKAAEAAPPANQPSAAANPPAQAAPPAGTQSAPANGAPGLPATNSPPAGQTGEQPK
jgi:cytochrome c